ncbi:hypothetical protein F8M41_009301 [Gigaspora margarita]|uniref:Uncharacterized protein n=1 Tax=Gigaspora margarita TaxID=4874 RepID=A0A8H4EVD2_GIGMA|nr:hypothetical protein F8M41_009301 [Gigaspora margarita]
MSRHIIYLFILLICFNKSNAYNIVINRTFGESDYFNLDHADSYDNGTLLIGEKASNSYFPKFTEIHIIFTNGTNTTIDLLKLFNTNYSIIQFNALEPSFIFLVIDQQVQFSCIIPFNPYDLAFEINAISNINSKAGFLVTNIAIDRIKWAKYTVPLKLANNSTISKISKISEGDIPFPSNTTPYNFGGETLKTYTLFQKVDGGYGIAYCLTYPNNLPSHLDSNITDVAPYITVHVAFIPNSNTSKAIGPFVIYTTRNFSNIVFLDSCQSRYDSRGNECLISEINANARNLPAPGVVKITFLSTGSVMNIMPIPISTTSSSSITLYKYFSLHYGGDLFIKYSLTNESAKILGYYSDDSLNSFKQWDIPENLTIMAATEVYNRISSGLMINNTFWLALKDVNKNWSIVTSEMPRYLKDVGFQNNLITSSYPGINQTSINLYSNDSLNITYRNPISQSFGNISIYQINESDTKPLLLRQSFSGLSYCTILSDNITISCPILPSTFSVPAASYMILVDNGFVQDADLQEQIRGITNGLWIVQTESHDGPYTYSEQISGTILLSEDGTKYYNNLTSEQKDLFPIILCEELAQSIPIISSRLYFSGRINIDVKTSNKLFEIIITDSKNLSQPNAKQIMEDLKSLIGNKFITILSTLPHTIYIDDKHQFEQTPNLWDEISERKYWFIGFGIGLIILFIIYLLARHKHNKIKQKPEKCFYKKTFLPIPKCPHDEKCLLPNNCIKMQEDYYKENFSAKQCRQSVLLTSCLSLFHMALNILFIIGNAKDVPELYIPSIVFFSINIGLDFIFAVAIFTRKKKYSKYYFDKWLIVNLKWAALFTVLSSADVEILLILNSHLGGFEIFNAPFSKATRNYIFWCKVFTIIIDSIPWLIIQVLYRLKTITYQIIPLIDLVISCMSLITYILIKIYGYLHEPHNKRTTESKKDDEENEIGEEKMINKEKRKEEINKYKI